MTAPGFRFRSADAALWRPPDTPAWHPSDPGTRPSRAATFQGRPVRLPLAEKRARRLRLIATEGRFLRIDPERARSSAHGGPPALSIVVERHIRAVVEWADGNFSKAARQLGITRQTLHNRLSR